MRRQRINTAIGFGLVLLVSGIAWFVTVRTILEGLFLTIAGLSLTVSGVGFKWELRHGK